MPWNITGCGVITACTIDMAGAATSPSTAGSNYGIFGYSGVGLGISSTASGGGQGIGFFTCGDYERMRLTSAGNLGIGTTSPCSKLHVASGPNTDGLFISKLAACTNKQGIFISADDSAGAYIAGGTAPDGTAIQTDGFGRLILQNGATEGFQFQTSAVTVGSAQSWTTRMVIKQSGNVGIGTTSPSTPLQIRSNTIDAGGSGLSVFGYDGAVEFTTTRAESPANAAIYLYNRPTSGTNGTGTGISFRASSTNTADRPQGGLYTSWTDSTDATRTAKFYFDLVCGGTYATRMTILGNGNLGVGCSLPRNKVEIIGGTSSPDLCAASCDLLKIGGSGNSALNIGSTVVSPYGMWFQVKHQNLDINTYPIIFQPCGGNTGVGIMNPTYKLHVNGTFYAAGSSIAYKEGICQYDTNSCLFMCLKPVSYQYKDEWKHLGKELKSETQIGLIAEDVAEVMPELAVLVNEEDTKVVRNVDYEKLSIILLSEVQKLRREVDELKK